MTERSKRAASKAKPKDDDDFVEKIGRAHV